MRSETPNPSEVGRLISADASLAAGVFKTANSPHFGFRRRARSVREALLILGLDIAGRAVASISLGQAFPSNGQLERFCGALAKIAAWSGLPATSRFLVAAAQIAEHFVQPLTGGSRTEEWGKLDGWCLRLLKPDQRHTD